MGIVIDEPVAPPAAPDRAGKQRARRAVPVAVAGLLAVAVLISPALGRATPAGSYRPELPGDPIALGCYPLPAGLTLDFPYTVRSDGDDGRRRVLTLHWSRLDEQEVRHRLDAALRRAGLRPGAATVTPFAGIPDDSVVRGAVVLRLPVVPLTGTDPACLDPVTTKRFPAGWKPSTEYP